jgi:hypothetical protein
MGTMIILVTAIHILFLCSHLTTQYINAQDKAKANKTVLIPSNKITLPKNTTTINASNQMLLEDIKDSINQLRKSFDDSTLLSIIGLIAGLIAIAVAIVIPYIYEKAKRPNLVVQPRQASVGNWEKYLHCKVVNMPHQHGFGRWLGIERNPAINTIVTMEFFTLDAKSLLNEKIPAKWDSAPEPLDPDRRFDSSKLAFLYRETITSDQNGESFSVVVKHRNERECYVMTGDNYQADFKGMILHNSEFRIDEQKFLVKIQATSGSHSSRTTTFIITNEGNQFEAFTIFYFGDKNKL